MKKMEEILTEAAERIRGGDEKRVRAQHDAGRLTARERVMELMDPGSFMELETLRKDSNLVAGFGTVHTRPVYCIAQDHASCGGAMTASQAAKMKRTLELAGQTGAPVVLMPDSAGVKVTEGSVALPAYAQVFSAMTALSGVSPMLCYVAGQCTGIAVMMTQLADLTVQVQKNGLVAMHAATVMNSEKGHAKSEEALFGADTMTLQGAVALKAEDEKSGLGLVKQLLDALPSSNLEDAPYVDTDELNRLLKTEDAQDAVSLCHELADGGRTIELFADYGTRAHTVFAHIGGRSYVLIQDDLHGVPAAFCIAVAAVDMDGGVMELAGALENLALPGVDPDIFRFRIFRTHAAQRGQPQAAAALDLGHHGAQGIGVGGQHNAVGGILTAQIHQNAALGGDDGAVAQGLEGFLSPAGSTGSKAGGGVHCQNGSSLVPGESGVSRVNHIDLLK